jgi:hypothetical protein
MNVLVQHVERIFVGSAQNFPVFLDFSWIFLGSPTGPTTTCFFSVIKLIASDQASQHFTLTTPDMSGTKRNRTKGNDYSKLHAMARGAETKFKVFPPDRNDYLNVVNHLVTHGFAVVQLLAPSDCQALFELFHDALSSMGTGASAKDYMRMSNAEWPRPFAGVFGGYLTPPTDQSWSWKDTAFHQRCSKLVLTYLESFFGGDIRCSAPLVWAERNGSVAGDRRIRYPYATTCKVPAELQGSDKFAGWTHYLSVMNDEHENGGLMVIPIFV